MAGARKIAIFFPFFIFRTP